MLSRVLFLVLMFMVSILFRIIIISLKEKRAGLLHFSCISLFMSYVKTCLLSLRPGVMGLLRVLIEDHVLDWHSYQIIILLK